MLGPASPREDLAGSAAVRRALAYLEVHCQEEIGIIDLARAVGVSTRTLQQVFRSELGMTPMSALMEIRMRGARRDLQRMSLKKQVLRLSRSNGVSPIWDDLLVISRIDSTSIRPKSYGRESCSLKRVGCVAKRRFGVPKLRQRNLRRTKVRNAEYNSIERRGGQRLEKRSQTAGGRSAGAPQPAFAAVESTNSRAKA